MPHEHHNGSSYLWRSEMQIIVTLPFTLLLGLFLCWCTCKIRVDEDVFFYLGSSFIKILLFLGFSARSVSPASKHGFPHARHLTGSENIPSLCLPHSPNLPPVSLSLFPSLPLSFMCTAVSDACDSTCSFIDESLSLLGSL